MVQNELSAIKNGTEYVFCQATPHHTNKSEGRNVHTTMVTFC